MMTVRSVLTRVLYIGHNGPMSNTTPEPRRLPSQYRPEECYDTELPNGLNWYGLPIVLPEYYEAEHYTTSVPPSAGNPPVCSCGWTRWSPDGKEYYELSDHLRDMAL